MKKLVAVLLIAVVVLCSAIAQASSESIPGMQEIIIMNDAFADLPLSSQCYNAKEYHKAYNLGEIIDENFWFQPKADAQADIVAFTDFYIDSTSLNVFRQKFVSFTKDNPAFDYDIFVGPQQKESYDVKYKGFCKIGNEGFLFVPEDGWNVDDLFFNSGFVAADSYEFVSVTGETVELKADELADYEIVMDGKECVDLKGAKNLDALKYMIPKGLTRNSIPAAEGISRFTVMLCADGVYKTAPKYTENRAGSFYDSWSIADLLDKYGTAPCEEVQVISWKDGYSQNEPYQLFFEKYMAFQAPLENGKQKEFFTLGRVQPRNAGVSNIGYLVMEKEAFAYIPESGLLLSDAFRKTGMYDAALYLLTYSDGYEKLVRAEEADTMTVNADSGLVSIRVFL
jgi:hypothetical protein